MTFDRRSVNQGSGSHEGSASTLVGPGKHTLTEQLPPIQAKAPRPATGAPAAAAPAPAAKQDAGANDGVRDEAAIHESAARGIATPASALPHADTIQQAFGRHDVSSIQAHAGGDAAGSARDMGADAYATGNHVVLGGKSDLFTVAHEAAHVVQQRGGVQLKGGVGAEGDAYEQHADQVAHRVVAGQSAEGLLDQMAGGGGGGGNMVQRLPLTTPWHRPASQDELLASVQAYLTTTLAPEMAEVTADDRGEDDQYDPGWKSNAVRCFDQLRRTVEAGNAAQAADLTGQLQILLAAPGKRSHTPDIMVTPPEPPGRAIETQHGPVTRVPERMREESHRADVATSDKIKTAEPGLLSGNAQTRTGAVDRVRGSDEKYTPGQGAILRQFIPEYRAAMLALIRQARGADAVFSIERGGSLIADMMQRMDGITPEQNQKVAKPTEADVRAYDHDHPSGKLDEMLAKPSGQKQVHMELFKQRIRDFVAAQTKPEVTIAVTETVVGGGSASLVLKTINELCEELRGSPTKVHFKLLMARETIKNTGTVGRGTLKVQDPVHIDDDQGGKGVQFPKAVHTDNLPQVEAFLAQTRYLIGEDVDYQVQYGGDASKKPVIVFQGSNDDLVAMKITPAADQDTARQVLMDLVAGVYDEVMARELGPA